MGAGFALSYNSTKVYQWGVGLDEKTVPVGAVRFLEKTTLNGVKMYNSLEFGGYLTWRLFPRFRIAQDGRAEIFAPLQREFDAIKSEAAYQEVMQRYGFQLAVLTFTPTNTLEQALRTDPMWVLVYWDDKALVYARRHYLPEEFFSRWAYEYFSPFSLDYSYLKEPVEAGKGDLVVRELRRAIGDNPGNAFKPWVYLGYVQQLMNRPAQAAAAYEKALAANPSLGRGHYRLLAQLGKLYLLLNQPAKAVETFEQHYAIHQPRDQELLQYALTLYRLKRYDPAEKRFRAYLSAHPGDAVALADLGFLLFDTGRLEEAADLFSRSARENNKGPGLYGLALTHQRRGNCREALPIWRQFIQAQERESHWTREARQLMESCAAAGVKN